MKQNLTEEEAFNHERYMISVFGRIGLGTGILFNKTAGGQGPSGFGCKKSQEHKDSIKNLYWRQNEKNINNFIWLKIILESQ